ncbi:protein phosphatase 2C domain-containing protein [Brevibacillus sp. 179-C9.3 HS]|uniref:protein phosphatase 2C domain-containing protein n=1 Tax=unclassified Brevibacillus TaxID=2684853 RepID=UPI0039A174BC
MLKHHFAYDFNQVKTDSRVMETNAVSVTGTRNMLAKQANQDAFLVKIKPNMACMAVADGLGSCKHSATGAKMAVACVEEWIEHDLEKYKDVSDEVVTIFHRKLINRWKTKVGVADYRQFDTTLLYLIVTNRYALVGGIGDGMILCHLGRETTEYSWDKDDFSNRTLSLASNGAADLMKGHFIELDESSLPLTVILATDGVAEDLEPASKAALPEYLHSELLKSNIVDLQHELEQWVIHWKTEHHTDDRTFCMLNIYNKRELI